MLVNAQVTQDHHELHSITKAAYTRLPREIRDMILSSILTQDCLVRIYVQQFRDEFKEFYGRFYKDNRLNWEENSSPKRWEPPWISLFYPYFAAEMIDILYEKYPHFKISTPTKLPAFLGADMFGAWRTPRDAKLPSLTIKGSLDEGSSDSVSVKTLASDLKALSDCIWAPNFRLDITFSTELGISIFKARAIPRVARKIHKIWQIMHPWIVEAEERGATVYFAIVTRHPGQVESSGWPKYKRYGCLDGERDMLYTEKEWVKELKGTLGPECRWFRRERPGHTHRSDIFKQSRPKAYAVAHFIGNAWILVFCICWYLPAEARKDWNDRKRRRSVLPRAVLR
ncbi:hypothetical protein BKA58DRAFT_28840 [Alternaria rosae]|uniref:uncharacterized protein n=1 Tax=Alternaria rosae TaxID=1187941 RepID=UPI001E8D97A7|nr:uncharacterized protein BKA58DRAFT_28840 [Alternaria rosae]KAH6883025.1 hypothetical protein BKA58DRAFT_28840 [Alternaria rosae]